MIDDIPVARIEKAQDAIAQTIRKTPLVRSDALSIQDQSQVFLKCEHLQVTGSFKLRGATNAILNLDEEQRCMGVVGASTGNHGRALAYAARKANVRCTICMSSLVPQNKVDAVQSMGAEVRIVGVSQDEAQSEVDDLVATGMTMIPPFDHADVISGQGTLGLEVIEQQPDLDTVLVPLSGGGLISGVALALKAHRPDVRIVGVSMERGAAMWASQEAGKPVSVEEQPTLADSLGGGIGSDNRYTFEIVRRLVDEIVLVSEAEIAAAMRHCYWTEGQIVEGAGAVGVAALRSGKHVAKGQTAVLMCGGNVDATLHRRIAEGENVDLVKETAPGAPS